MCGALGGTIAMKDLLCGGGALELSGLCVVDISRTLSFRLVDVASANGLVAEFALGNAACVT